MYPGIGKEYLERNKAFSDHREEKVSISELEPSPEYIKFVNKIQMQARDPTFKAYNPFDKTPVEAPQMQFTIGTVPTVP